MKKIKNNLYSSTIYLLISNPNAYLHQLLAKTILIGVFTFTLTMIIHLLELEKFSIPAAMHSLIGIVIGLLLVFRTNTAYDRWWEGRKTISNLSSDIGFVSAKLNSISNSSNIIEIKEFENSLTKFLNLLKDYLKLGDDGKESSVFHFSQKKCIEDALIKLWKINIQERDKSSIENHLCKLLDHSNSLERIKNTPIPLSYLLHIKVSVFIYLITLPFGLFHDLGLWSTPMVMVVFYIMSGVEIISNEIENPFAGKINDLPIDRLFLSISKTLTDNKEQKNEEINVHKPQIQGS